MQKKLVFISHISAEKEIALAFKALVEEHFLSMIDVFVSSDPESIAMGGRWLDDITDALSRCEVELVFLSPQSLSRPWINFEAGAGWIRRIPVIPICHSGITFANLQPPLSNLQGATATKAIELKNVFLRLAKTLGCTPPEADFSRFIETVKAFEETSKQLTVAESKSLTPEVAGLRDYELATLVACGDLVQSPQDFTWPERIKERMAEAYFAPLATTLGLAGLSRKGLVEPVEIDTNGYGDSETAYTITPLGWQFFEENVDLLELKSEPQPAPKRRSVSKSPPNDDIPF